MFSFDTYDRNYTFSSTKPPIRYYKDVVSNQKCLLHCTYSLYHLKKEERKKLMIFSDAASWVQYFKLVF